MRSGGSAVAVLAALALAVGAAAATQGASGRPAPCRAAPIRHGPPPAWTAAAWTSSSPGFRLPYALATPANAGAILFSWPLRAGTGPPQENKILWIMRLPRDGAPLLLTARSSADPGRTLHLRIPADSEPGEIYPSGVAFPVAGCWRLTLRWGSHAASIDLQVAPATPAAHALRIPRIAPGSRCPVSPLHQIAGFVAPGLGAGPVYPVLGGTTLRVTHPPPAGAKDPLAGSSWGAGKVLWIATSAYRGPLLIRGRELDGSRLVRFGAGRNPAAQLALSAPGAYAVGEPEGWRAWPSLTRLRAGGCYAYQVDGTGFSDVVVFRASVGGAATGGGAGQQELPIR